MIAQGYDVTFAILFICVGICLSLVMSIAWAIAIRSGKSGWVDAIWSFAWALPALPWRLFHCQAGSMRRHDR